jgi:hypothetical protein
MIISILLSGGNISTYRARGGFFICLIFISLPLIYAIYKLSKKESSGWIALALIVCVTLLVFSLFILFFLGAYGFA